MTNEEKDILKKKIDLELEKLEKYIQSIDMKLSSIDRYFKHSSWMMSPSEILAELLRDMNSNMTLIRQLNDNEITHFRTSLTELKQLRSHLE